MGRETCCARDDFVNRGRAGDRSRGQCGTTALVVQDWRGGDLFVADVFIEGDSVQLSRCFALDPVWIIEPRHQLVNVEWFR